MAKSYYEELCKKKGIKISIMQRQARLADIEEARRIRMLLARSHNSSYYKRKKVAA